MVDAQQALGAVVLQKDDAFGVRTAHGAVPYVGLGEDALHGRALGVVYLNHHGGILGEKNFDEVGLATRHEALGAHGNAAA